MTMESDTKKYWTVLVSGYRPFQMVGEPMTKQEATQLARSIWPTAKVK